MKFLTAITFAFMLATEAHATMPMLTPDPKPATLQACQAWAAEQSEDALDMWGNSGRWHLLAGGCRATACRLVLRPGAS